ncbi:ATP-binding protein [Aliiglaciecola sp. CAU 1673]|nr:PAS domain-containing sensor histidine kinase [Aliiglaciecola sp. CAU 1673]MDF2177140.1 ATP-binding protein [Aliiglaciecola sp. CAU 1673]
MINFGLSGGGILLLIGAAFFACFLLSFRTAGIYATLSLLVLMTQWWLAFKGELSYGLDIGDYAKSGSAWLNVAMAFTFLITMILYLTRRFFDYLIDLLAHYHEKVQDQSRSLDDSKALIDGVVNAIPMGILWKDKNGGFLGANQSFLQEVGKNKVQDILGKTDFDITDATTAKRYRALDIEVITSGKAIIDSQEKTVKSGNTHYISTDRMPLVDHAGDIVGVLCTYHDITHLKRAEMLMHDAKLQAEQANAAKTAFLANMSHELRTPINGVMGLLELCLNTELNSKQQDYLSKAKVSAKTLLDIVNDILDLAKIEAGQLTLDRHPFELEQMLEVLQEHVTPLLEGKDVQFYCKSDAPKGLLLEGDDTRLKQILLNLCGNAVKFTNQGSVKLSCTWWSRGKKADLVFKVKDTGIGIADEAIPTLFNSFTQADTSTTRKFGGTGLGLSIVRQLVDKMGGDIRVNSVLGKGTEFVVRLTLPVVQSATNTSVESVQNAPEGLQDIQVLLVEDNAINLEICREMLTQQGALVHCVENGAKALEAIKARPFDVVLMDIQMPVMDGCEAIEHIRAQPEYAKLPVIAVTANVLASDVERYLKLGFNACLSKPYERKKLLALVTQYGKVGDSSCEELTSPQQA